MKKHFLAGMTGREPLITELRMGGEIESSTGVYLGIGLCTRHKLTEHIPFDALSMILAGELIKRKLKLRDGTIIVADTHAKTNGFPDKKVDLIAKTRKYSLHAAMENIGFAGWDILLGSDMAGNGLYRDILSRMERRNQYEKLQLADTEFMRREGRSVKVGWSHRTLGFDEKHFDELYESEFGNPSTFVYVEPGRRLDGRRFSPYVHDDSGQRLYMEADEDTDAKVSAMPRKVMAYFGRILDLFDQTVYERRVQCQNRPDIFKRRLEEAYATIFHNRR